VPDVRSVSDVRSATGFLSCLKSLFASLCVFVPQHGSCKTPQTIQPVGLLHKNHLTIKQLHAILDVGRIASHDDDLNLRSHDFDDPAASTQGGLRLTATLLPIPDLAVPEANICSE
jgi:hypothetical protein